jgi:phage gp36-like protein
MQRYLHPGDYTMQIRKEIKDLLGGADEGKLIVAENAAVGQMKSYLKKLYDIDKIFYLISKWDPAIVYQAPADPEQLGTLAFFKADTAADEQYKVYQVVTTTAAGESPESAAAKWSLFTSRNPFVIMYLVDITLYHLHSKDASRLMPKVREERYADALDWLKMVGKGEINADLPQKTVDDPGFVSDIRFNSNPPENQRW